MDLNILNDIFSSIYSMGGLNHLCETRCGMGMVIGPDQKMIDKSEGHTLLLLV